MFQDVWTYADMSFGFGGLIIGISMIAGARWARSSGIILCLLAASSNLLWFSEYFDRGLPRLMLVGTGFATPSGSAGHAGETANLKLTFHLDHSAGADQLRIPTAAQFRPETRANCSNSFFGTSLTGYAAEAIARRREIAELVRAMKALARNH
jgi:hypothetical protein